MTAVVLGCVVLVVGLLLAFNVKGLGTAWIEADLRWTTRKCDEVMSRRARRRRAYFWFLVALGVVILVTGIFSVV